MKRASTIIVISLLFALSSSGIAQTTSSANADDTVKVQSKVRQYADSKKRVVVTTISGNKSKGYITTFDSDKFTISDPKAGRSETFKFSDVRKVGKSGGLSAGTIIAIASLGAAAAIVYGVVLAPCRNEGGCF